MKKKKIIKKIKKETGNSFSNQYKEGFPVSSSSNSNSSGERSSSSSNSSSSCKHNPCTCAKIVNFRQKSALDTGNGVLEFLYFWDSSTGNLADLKGTFFEEVTYPGAGNPYIPGDDPPFKQWGFPNPTIEPKPPIPGSDGVAGDKHSPGGGFSTPYKAATFSATQNYYYICQCGATCCKVVAKGPITIKRSVIQGLNGVWQYKIEKDGSSAVMNLPNQVVPAPAPKLAVATQPISIGSTRRELLKQFIPFEGLSTRDTGRYTSIQDLDYHILVRFHIESKTQDYTLEDTMNDVISKIETI